MAHVLIVGAGPAGASLAHLLAHRGIDVTLLERQRDFAREFRGEILMPSGVAVFEQMGLAPALAEVPTHRLPRFALYLGGRRVLELDLEERLLAVSQPGMLEMLVAESGRSPHFRLERGASVGDLLVEDGRVAGVRTRSADGERELRADLVVGADGRGSVVRRRSGLAVRDLGTPMDVVWCKLPCPEDWQGARFYLGGGHLLAGYRTWDGTLQIGWVILKGTFGELRSRGIGRWVEEMAKHVSPDFAEHLRAHADAAASPFLLSTKADRVRPWSRPGLVLLGDAAHTMSPVGGQGINIALRDTLVAANHLVPALASPAPDPARVDAALRSIEAERLREVAPIQRLQALPPRLLLARARWGEPARRLAGAFLRLPPVRTRIAPRVLRRGPFTAGVTEVRLRV